MLRRLRPATLDSLGLSATLRELVESWQYRQEVETNFNANGPIDDLGESININLYRIVQEALTNISRHARARTVAVDLRGYGSGSAPESEKNWVRLLIRDDGVGMPIVEQSAGLGVLGMRERVRALGGQIGIDSPPGGGTTITITIPYTKTRG